MSGGPRPAVLACLLAVIASACGGGGSSGTPAAPNPPPAAPSPSPPAPAPVGLDARPVNTSCIAPARPSGTLALGVVRAFGNLVFSSPVALLQAPADPGRWFVVEQDGKVLSFPDVAGTPAASTFVDLTDRVLSGGELGLLGMAFHPQYASNRRVFLSYTTGEGSVVSRISEFVTRDGGATLDPASERILLSVEQPQRNHNGGGIAFGPDGFLYIGLGDGGGAGDQHGVTGNGQNLRTLLGKMLRIDVDATAAGFGYAIPASNPFAGNPPCGIDGRGAVECPEIFAYGFRNPWRWSFDRGTGELWVGDVGQGAWEEVDRVTPGGNFGWRCREGAHPFAAQCGPAQNLLDPVSEYDRSAGFSITGGYVYRGSSIPALRGRYVFGDFGSGRIWHVARDTQPTLQVTAEQGLASALQISSFAEGHDGELYVVHYGGTLHRLVASDTSAGDTIPSRLVASGCVEPATPARAAGGLIPYAPNASYWADGATLERWLGLPEGQSIVVGADGDWELPAGSVVMQHLRLAQRLVETRLLMRHPDGVWAGYTYAWNDAQNEATRVIGGSTLQLDGRPWIIPSEAQCLACHGDAAGRSLGLETAQLNGDLTYPQTGRTANQLHTLNSIGVLSPALVDAPGALPAMPDPFGSGGTEGERARAYLHVNCAHCHRPGGGTPVSIDLRYTSALGATGACDTLPEAGDLGIADARIIAPGDAARSVLVARMGRRDAAAMPPLASAALDERGIALVGAWIAALTRCD